MCGITGSAPVPKSKQDGCCSPVKVSHKLHRWHARRRYGHVQHVGNRCNHEDLCRNQLSAHVVNFRSKQLDSVFTLKAKITGLADHSMIKKDKN